MTRTRAAAIDLSARKAAAGEGPVTRQLWAIANFYFEHWTRHQDYFQIFWAIDNQSVIGDLPGPVIDEVTRLWEQSLQILDHPLYYGQHLCVVGQALGQEGPK